MATIDWTQLGGGLLQGGGNLLLQQMKRRQAESELRRAQGPLYNQQQSMAGQSLALASGMDPRAAAAERFEAQQALQAPGNAAAEQALMRQLHKQGLLGVSSFQPVPGTVQTPGVGMNPHMAALYAAQQGARSQAAYDALREGEGQIDRMVNRSGALQGQAQRAQQAGMLARAGMPQKPSVGQTLLSGGLKLLQDPKAIKTIGGLLGSAGGWLRDLNFSNPFSTSMWGSSYDSGSGIWE
jgi:hypothetical protein